jgi:hypothetical protein
VHISNSCLTKYKLKIKFFIEIQAWCNLKNINLLPPISRIGTNYFFAAHLLRQLESQIKRFFLLFADLSSEQENVKSYQKGLTQILAE